MPTDFYGVSLCNLMANLEGDTVALQAAPLFFYANGAAPPQSWDNLAAAPLSREYLADAIAEQRRRAQGPPERLPIGDPRLEWMRVAPPDLPVSDHGLDGALPLPASTWNPGADPLSDTEWAAQNRKINDFLAGRTRA